MSATIYKLMLKKDNKLLFWIWGLGTEKLTNKFYKSLEKRLKQKQGNLEDKTLKETHSMIKSMLKL